MKRVRTKKLFILMCLAALLLAPGCGGGGGGGTTPAPPAPAVPSVSLASPAPGSTVSDVDFRAEAFAIQINYSNASAMNFSTLSVTLKMDNGAPQDITAYFSKTSETVIQSSNLNEFNQTLFVMSTNEVTRTMTVTVTIKSLENATGTTTASFTVYPDLALPPPPAPPSA